MLKEDRKRSVAHNKKAIIKQPNQLHMGVGNVRWEHLVLKVAFRFWPAHPSRLDDQFMMNVEKPNQHVVLMRVSSDAECHIVENPSLIAEQVC